MNIFMILLCLSVVVGNLGLIAVYAVMLRSGYVFPSAKDKYMHGFLTLNATAAAYGIYQSI